MGSREGLDVARCTVARLMKAMGIQRVIRGKPHKTTIPDKKLPCPLDRVNRQFRVLAPNMLWVSDFTSVATWKGPRHGHSDQWRSRGSISVAFVIDAYVRRIVALRDLHANPFRVTAWRVSTTPHAGFGLDALEQAVHERRPVKAMGRSPLGSNQWRLNGSPSFGPWLAVSVDQIYRTAG